MIVVVIIIVIIIFLFCVLLLEGLFQIWGRRVIGISGSVIWSKTLMELIFNPSGEFRWSPEGPGSQIHSPHLHVGAPGIFSDLLRSVQMLKREWDAESNGKLPHLFIPSKTAALAPEFVVKDLPSAELQPWFLSLQWRTCSWAEHCDDDDSKYASLLFLSSQAFFFFFVILPSHNPFLVSFFFYLLIHLYRGLPHGHFLCILKFNILCDNLPFSILFRCPNYFNLFFSVSVNFSTITFKYWEARRRMTS